METIRKPKILITFVEAGMGHIVSAEAISEALTKKYGDKMEIINSFILRDSDNPILPAYEKFLVENTKKYSSNPLLGDLQFSSMHLIGAQNSLKFVHNVVFGKQTRAMIDEYAKYDPDLIICTHYFLLFTAIEYRRKCKKDVAIVAYCPDNNVHGWWDIRADCIYTNNPMATGQAYRLNFANGHVREVFYPTRKDVVAANETKEFYREKFGIPKDRFAVVVADGIYAKAKLKKVCLSLLKTDLPLTLCVLAGKNTEMKSKFDALIGKTKPNIKLMTFGFLKNAPELYAACDLFITKGGPNAVLDSVMMGTPVLIDYCASPIERATKKLFIDLMHCGFYWESPLQIRAQVEELIRQPELLEQIKPALSYFDKSKNGAEEIADDIAEILWNRHVRMRKILTEEEQAISRYFEEKAEKKRAEAEKKVEKLNSTAAKKSEILLAAAETHHSPAHVARAKRRAKRRIETIQETTETRAEQIIRHTEEKAQKIDEQAKKAGESVWDGGTSRYSKKVASVKSKKMISGKPTDEP